MGVLIELFSPTPETFHTFSTHHAGSGEVSGRLVNALTIGLEIGWHSDAKENPATFMIMCSAPIPVPLRLVVPWSAIALLTSCTDETVEAQQSLPDSASLEAASEAAAIWPGFRGPGGMGLSQGTDLPQTWNLEENLAWKTELPGGGSSSPIVFGDRIYLTAYTGYLEPGSGGGSLDSLERHLLCISSADGSILWSKPEKARLPEEERIRDHGYAANTPAADQDHVYVFYGKSGVIAYDHEGAEVWRADVGSNTSGWGSSASPVLYQDKVFINACVESGALIALDRVSGEELWRAGGIEESWSTPVIVKTDAGADELVLSAKGKVSGYDPSTGENLWSCDTDITWYMAPSPVAADGVVYALGGRSGITALAVRAGGRGDVTSSHRLWTSQKGSNVSSPVYHDGHLYWAHESLGVAYCAKAETGELVYEERLDRAGQVYASSILADGKVYHLSRSGRMFVLPASPQYELISMNELRDGTQFNASPAVLGSQILIRSEKYLYCVGREL